MKNKNKRSTTIYCFKLLFFKKHFDRIQKQRLYFIPFFDLMSEHGMLLKDLPIDSCIDLIKTNLIQTRT